MKTHTALNISFTICLAITVLFSLCFVPLGLAASSDEASEDLRLAGADLNSAFGAVAEAENAGANVSALLSTLNDADGFLSEGYAAYRNENFEGAVSSAAACSSTLKGVADAAVTMKLSAERIRSDKVFLTAVVSVVGLVMLFVLGFLVWGFLKRSYSKRALK